MRGTRYEKLKSISVKECEQEAVDLNEKKTKQNAYMSDEIIYMQTLN